MKDTAKLKDNRKCKYSAKGATLLCFNKEKRSAIRKKVHQILVKRLPLT